ncbi:membrane protein [Fibrobacterales bacterium]|nr:membrane protein [Fibrobacterales bacterium]
MFSKLSFIFLCAFAVIGAQQLLSLEKAISLAVEKNEKSLLASEGIEIAKGHKREQLGKMFPSISLTGGWTKINDDLEIDLNGIRDAMIYLHSAPPNGVGTLPAAVLEQRLPSFSKKVQNDNFWNAAVQAQWAIFTGGRLWSQYKAASGEETVAEAKRNAVVGGLAKETALRYFSLMLVEANKKVQEENLASINTHFENAKKLQDAGQIANTERLRAEVALAEAQMNLQDAKRNAEIARLALANSINADTNFTIIAEWKKIEPPSLATIAGAALEGNPNLKQIASEESRAKNGVSAASGEWFPAVALFGMKELYTRDLTVLQPDWAFGVKAEWNLFSRTTTLGKRSAAKAQVRALNYMGEAAARDIKLGVEKYLREWSAANEKLETLEKTENLARTAFNAQELAFSAGMATGLDVIDARFALSRVQLAKMATYFETYKAFAELQDLCGNAEEIGRNW